MGLTTCITLTHCCGNYSLSYLMTDNSEQTFTKLFLNYFFYVVRICILTRSLTISVCFQLVLQLRSYLPDNWRFYFVIFIRFLHGASAQVLIARGGDIRSLTTLKCCVIINAMKDGLDRDSATPVSLRTQKHVLLLGHHINL